jgi:hypothetical protein
MRGMNDEPWNWECCVKKRNIIVPVDVRGVHAHPHGREHEQHVLVLVIVILIVNCAELTVPASYSRGVDRDPEDSMELSSLKPLQSEQCLE